MKLFKNYFQKGVLFKSQIVFRKTPTGDVQIRKKKRKRNGIACGQQTSKYLTDKISDQTFNSHVNVIFQYIYNGTIDGFENKNEW